jgi:hypothetical protein
VSVRFLLRFVAVKLGRGTAITPTLTLPIKGEGNVALIRLALPSGQFLIAVTPILNP